MNSLMETYLYDITIIFGEKFWFWKELLELLKYVHIYYQELKNFNATSWKILSQHVIINAKTTCGCCAQCTLTCFILSVGNLDIFKVAYSYVKLLGTSYFEK